MEIVNGNLSWFLLNLNSKFSHFLLILRRRGICSAACDYLNLFTAHITCDGSRHKSGACQLNIYPSSTWFSEWTLATNTGVMAEMNEWTIIQWNKCGRDGEMREERMTLQPLRRKHSLWLQRKFRKSCHHSSKEWRVHGTRGFQANHHWSCPWSAFYQEQMLFDKTFHDSALRPLPWHSSVILFQEPFTAHNDCDKVSEQTIKTFTAELLIDPK